MNELNCIDKSKKIFRKYWIKYGLFQKLFQYSRLIEKKNLILYQNSSMSRIHIAPENCTSLRAKQQRKIMIEELMFNQMQETLGRKIVDYVDQTRQTLQHVGLAKTRKIVLTVEKNLNKFMKGCYHNKIRLASDFYANLNSYDKQEQNFPTCDMFSSKLLNKQLQKVNNNRFTIQQQGALRRNLFSANRKIRRVDSANVVLSIRKSQCYSAKHRGRNENIFNLIVQK